MGNHLQEKVLNAFLHLQNTRLGKIRALCYVLGSVLSHIDGIFF